MNQNPQAEAEPNSTLLKTVQLQAGVNIDQRYVLELLIGVGGMGEVWKALDTRLGRSVAVKFLSERVMPEATQGSAEVQDRFRREIELLARLKGSGVVRITDRGDMPNGQVYLVMEYLEGLSLQECLDQMASENKEPGSRRLAVLQVLHLLESLGGILREPHALGIVHRDIKPANIFLQRIAGGREEIRLLDFGIAKALGETRMTSSGFILGTVAYMAPEQFRGQSDVYSDLYSVGVVAYQSLAGRIPFSGTLAEVMHAHMSVHPEPFPSELRIPTELELLIGELMEKDPLRRLGSAEMLVRRVQQIRGKLSGQTEQLTTIIQPRIRPPTAVDPNKQRKARRRISLKLKPSYIFVTFLVALLAGLYLSAGSKLFDVGSWMGLFNRVRLVSIYMPGWVPQSIRYPNMAKIPAGPFLMGCQGKEDCEEDEPDSKPSVASFLIDKTEVTVSSYSFCVWSGACKIPMPKKNCNYGRKEKSQDPINCVTWKQADSYCEWVGKRLPTEREWEKAARGTDGRKYPWGDEPEITCDYAALPKCQNKNSTWKVGSMPQGVSPYGVFNMMGNVQEWTSSWYDDLHTRKVLRGGSWYYPLRYARASSRTEGRPTTSHAHLGFRCVVSMGED